jgi:hypothetical protein
MILNAKMKTRVGLFRLDDEYVLACQLLTDDGDAVEWYGGLRDVSPNGGKYSERELTCKELVRMGYSPDVIDRFARGYINQLLLTDKPEGSFQIRLQTTQSGNTHVRVIPKPILVSKAEIEYAVENIFGEKK